MKILAHSIFPDSKPARFNFLLVYLLILLPTGCGVLSPDVGPGTTPSEPSDFAVSGNHIATVMTYNILMGGGVTEEARAYPGAIRYPGNRLPKILKIIRAVDPDILCLQELWFWSDSVAQDVADSLRMNYRMSINEENGHSGAIFSKFKITETDTFPGRFRNSALCVTRQPPWGKPINVFGAHLAPPLDSASTSIRNKEVDFLISQMADYKSSSSILLGDLNFPANSGAENAKLVGAGWVLVAEAGTCQPPGGQGRMSNRDVGSPDHIWAPRAFAPKTRGARAIEDYPIPQLFLDECSDHYPALALVGID